MKFSRRDVQALERQNAQLKAANAYLAADNANLREKSEKLLASCQVMIDELAGTTMEHHAEDGTVRRGRFFDVLAFDNLGSVVARGDGGGPHVQ